MTPVRRVAVVGTGVVGLGWTALFLARGLDVIDGDPAAVAERTTAVSPIGRRVA